MSSCPTKLYPLVGVQAQTIAKKVHDETGMDIDLTQPSGRASSHGITLSWKVSENMVAVTVEDKPWIVSCGTIFGRLDELFTVS
jgi:hypothetical protein